MSCWTITTHAVAKINLIKITNLQLQGIVEIVIGMQVVMTAWWYTCPCINKCTHSAEPSPYGKQEWFSHWQENNCRQYLTIVIIITIIILGLYRIYVYVHYNIHFKSYIEAQVCGFNHVDVDEMKWMELKIDRKLRLRASYRSC